MKHFKHDNIVEFIGYVDEPKQLDIVMELIPNGSLTDLIRQQTSKIELRKRICIDISKAIQHLHSNGIIHRDIKAGNVLLTSLNYQSKIVAKICDFETCCKEEDSVYDKKIGTPIYIPPEQWNSKRMTKESDIYALSILFYECMDNHIAYDNDNFPNEWSIAMFICTGKRLERPKECTDLMWDIITKCWDSEPSKRLTIDEIVSSLK